MSLVYKINQFMKTLNTPLLLLGIATAAIILCLGLI